jgi:hypothetical protein
MRRFSTLLFASIVAVLHSGVGAAQTLQMPALNLTGAPAISAAANAAGEGVGQFRPRQVSNGLPHFGVGVKAGTLGIGIQVGTALAPRVNLRGGVNFFSYKDSLTESGVLYTGTLQLRSVEAKLDLFAIGGFRFTPGLLLYNDNKISATAAVGPSQSFTLGGVRYFSSATDPIRGSAALTLNKFAPTLGIGFGNLLPRSSRHFSLSTDLGVVFEGSPQFALDFTGSACPNGTNCQPIKNLPTATQDIEKERVKIQDDLKPFKYYPELSIMFGYKF